MKKYYYTLTAILLALIMLSSCGSEGSANSVHTHAWSEWTILEAATCTENGTEERLCDCGEKETQQIEALGHTEVIDNAVAPSCTESGKSEGKHCSICNVITVNQTEINATGHTFNDWQIIKTATCTEAGSEERFCNCGEKETRQTEAIGHTEVIDNAVSPTCTKPGKSEGKHCNVCHAIIVSQSEIKATGHIFSDWKTEKTETCTSEGIKTRACFCGEKQTEAIPTTAHSYINGVCTVCGKEDPATPNPEKIYNDALNLLNSGKYEDAYNKFITIKDKKDVNEYLNRFIWVYTTEKYTNHSGTVTRTTTYTYGANGNIEKAHETDSRGIEYITTYTYGTTGESNYIEETRLEVGTDNNLITTSLYDKKGALKEQSIWSSIEEAEYSILYQYDSNGLLIKESNNNFNMPYTIDYTYDKNGKLSQSSLNDYFSSTVTKYEYDKNGNLIKETTQYYDGESSISYEYDANGNLTIASKSSGEVTEYSGYKLIYRS